MERTPSGGRGQRPRRTSGGEGRERKQGASARGGGGPAHHVLYHQCRAVSVQTRRDIDGIIHGR